MKLVVNDLEQSLILLKKTGQSINKLTISFAFSRDGWTKPNKQERSDKCLNHRAVISARHFGAKRLLKVSYSSFILNSFLGRKLNTAK